MSKKTAVESKRDMPISPFGEILATLANNCDKFEAAIFFDTEGESMDYFSLLDPFVTRLMAAHKGILCQSLRYRMEWLGMGTVNMIEVFSETYETITVCVNEEYNLTIVVRSGGNTPDLHDKIVPVVAMLRDEI